MTLNGMLKSGMGSDTVSELLSTRCMRLHVVPPANWWASVQLGSWARHVTTAGGMSTPLVERAR